MSTAGVATVEAVGALALSTVACAAGVTAAVPAIRDSANDPPTTADPPVGVGSCEGLAVALAGSDDEDCCFDETCCSADGPGKPISGRRAGTTAALPVRRPARVEVSGCFDRVADRRGCREACERSGGGDGVTIGCCNSLAALAVEAGILELSAVGASVAAVDPSAVGDDTPASTAVDALEGAGANALGATAVVEALAAAVGASGATAVVEIEGCVTAVSLAKRATLSRCT